MSALNTADTAGTAGMAAALEGWAGDRLAGTGPVEVARLGAGHSNLTFLVRRGEHAWVLRRPPFGPLLPSAHDVLREAKVLDLLAGSGVPVPAVALTCADPRILGAPFYLMERLPGEVVREHAPAWFTPPKRGRAMGDLIRALAALRTVPTEPFHAACLGRPGGYLTRQLTRWAAQRELVREHAAAAGRSARDLPDYDTLRDWLHSHAPATDSATGLVHGDAKLDNALLDPATGTLTALLDWEMATIGDPLADLGYLLFMSPSPHWPSPFPALTGEVTALPGFPTPAEIITHYEQQTATTTGPHLLFYVVLAGWKIAILLEASYNRHLTGTTDDPLFPLLEHGVPALLTRARHIAETGQFP